MVKKCSCCKETLEITQFNWKKRGVKRSCHCKTCSRKYVKNHYKKNKKYYLNKAKKRNFITRGKAHEYIINFLKKNPCIDCGEKDILVLEFDHKNRRDKSSEITTLVRGGYSQRKIIAEIKKCDVRCANCHRRKTEKENNSWRLEYMPKNQ